MDGYHDRLMHRAGGFEFLISSRRNPVRRAPSRGNIDRLEFSRLHQPRDACESDLHFAGNLFDRQILAGGRQDDGGISIRSEAATQRFGMRGLGVGGLWTDSSCRRDGAIFCVSGKALRHDPIEPENGGQRKAQITFISPPSRAASASAVGQEFGITATSAAANPHPNPQ